MRTLLAAVSIALLFAFAGGAEAQTATLFGTVGPGFTIRLADGSGNPVTNLAPGTYTIQVDDKATIHNFHLTGPGVDSATDIEQVGMVTWTVTLATGTYHYQCDPHALTMKGDFTVGSAPPAPSPALVKKAVSLAASVGPGTRITVARLGARLRTIAPGPAVIVVTDRSAKENFHLLGPGVNRATSRLGK
jgi:hypothetical protein